MNLNNMMQISPAKISIITRLRGINTQNINTKEKNNSFSPKNPQYTMFTLKNNSPSDILYISERPLEVIKINEMKKLSTDTHHALNFLNFDKVYPQSFPLDAIYQQILQNSINDLFYKKNSCMFFFGPTLGGKSYLLRGSPFKNDNESGLLTRAIKEIFQRIEYNNNFSVKISVYQIYLDKIYDLLSSNNDNNNNNNAELNIETNYSEINNVYNINIMGLTKKEIKDSNEYDLALREAINTRRNLSQVISVNDIKKKSNFIISIFLEKKNNTEDDNNINNNEYVPFSQFDFIELVSSNYGLLNEGEDNLNELNNIDKQFYQNTNEVFNSIAENIICLSKDSIPNNDTLLTLALKNTLKPNSNIIFVNCVIPWEFPLKDSYNSLKFTNMIFNHIYKVDNNSNYLNNIKTSSTNNLTYSIDYSENNLLKNVNQNRMYNINNNNNNGRNNINLSNSGYEKMNEYLNSLTIDKMDYLFAERDTSNTKNNNNLTNRNRINEINNDNNNNIFYTKYTNHMNNVNNKNKKIIKSNKHNKKNNTINKNKRIMNKSYDTDINNNINKKNNKKKNDSNNILTKKNNISFDNKEVSPKERRLKKLNEELKELEAKNNELNQNKNCIENDIMDNHINYIDYNSINEEKIKIIPNNNNINNTTSTIQYEKIKDEYADLKSNNIILKEDINRLEQANKNLESSLTEQRNRNMQIINQNEELSNRILKLEELLDEANIRDEKCKMNEINIEKLLNEKLFLNSRINEDEKEFKKMKEEKEKYEIEYKVLNAKYIELKNNYDVMNNDYCNIKLNQDEQFNKIECKIDNLLKEIEKLQSENNILRNENERQRMEMNNISLQRDDYKEKYNEQKNQNDLLHVKIGEIENEFNAFKKDKMNEEYYKTKYQENKKNRNENKLKIINELQNKIQKYRQQRIKQEIETDE